MQLQKYYFFKEVPSVCRTILVFKPSSFGKNYYMCVCVCVTVVWYPSTFIDGDAID
jgi:hypothetical protein